MYTVAVIPSNLRHEETIFQAASALNCLQSTITNIFDRIYKRISKNNEKINELSCRVGVASQEIQNRSSTNKAIQIFSPAKFPSSHVFRDIDLTFNDSEAVDSAFSFINEYEITSHLDLGSNIQEKLLFFHFRSSKNKLTASEISSSGGLGDIPTNLKSINSVLLFSTSENVYGTRKAIDEMNRVQRNRSTSGKKVEVITDHRLIIEPAPLSLSNRQRGGEKKQQGLFYTPTLNEAPTIDLPADLPDLPGIAGDIQFGHADTNQQIAPSFFFETLLKIPKIDVAVEVTAIKSEVSEEEDSAKGAMKTGTPTVPPPPPPPPPVLSEKKSVAPPPLVPPMNKAAVSSNQTLPPPEGAPEIDIRSNLMDAIRKAGGACGGRLRAAADVFQQTYTEQLHPVSDKLKVAAGGDLMADLHNKLLMRRKGISGAKDGQENLTHSGSVMSRLSSLIPPPPVKNQNSSSDEDDGDDADWAD